MGEMNDAIEKLESETSEIVTVTESAVALIGGLAQQIRDNAQNPSRLIALANQLDANANRLAAAVAENTPAA